MHKRALILAMLALLALVAAACGVNPAEVAQTARADILVVPQVAAGSLDPAGGAWEQAVPVQVPLTGMDIKGEWPIKLTQAVEVRALRDAGNLYFNLSWADATRDDRITDLDTFVDAAAVQLPAQAGATPYICMGQKGELVNLLYWRANLDQGENLIAGGYGTLTSLGDPDLPVRAAYANGRWSLVLARPLAADEQAMLNGQQVTAAFAVWNGSDQQRGGRKSTSQWITLSLQKPQA